MIKDLQLRSFSFGEGRDEAGKTPHLTSPQGEEQRTGHAFRRFKFENKTSKMLNRKLNLMW